MYYIFFSKKKKDKRYYVKVRMSNGKHKLVLNDGQYEQFKAWVLNAEGLYEITDDNNYMALNRTHMASVEVRKR
jgi:hypothetical protein